MFISENRFSTFTRKRIKGGALYIAVVVSIIIGILLSLFILLANFNQRQILVFSQSSQLYYDLNTALEMSRSAFFSPEINNTWIGNESGEDSVKIKKINWGAYVLINTQAKNRHQLLSKTGLYGTWMSADTGIVVRDNSRPVGVSGKVVFKADCYLPRAGIKPSYIEGQSYIASDENGAHIKSSPSDLKPVSDLLYKALEEQMRGPDLFQDSIVASLPQTYSRSFDQKAVAYQISGDKLEHVSFAQNIKLYADQVELDSSAHLEQILLICNKAHFKKGFRGQVQVIAKDSIVMEENCRFEYPSSLVLIGAEGKIKGLLYVQFSKDCKLYGAVLALSKEKSERRVMIKLHAQSEINGLLYSSDLLHLEGLLNANVFANKLFLKTPSAVYENHLLSCEINPKKYSSLIAVPMVFGNRGYLYNCRSFY